MIEKIVTRPIYYWGLPYILQVGGIGWGFFSLFLLNLGIAVPLIYYQDLSQDVLGIVPLKTACRKKARVWSVYFFWLIRKSWFIAMIPDARMVSRWMARTCVFLILLDQTDPLFSFLVYRKKGQKGVTFWGWFMLTWHNALLTAWWTVVQTVVVKALGWLFYTGFLKLFSMYYA